MRILITLIAILMTNLSATAQLYRELSDRYDQFREKTITERRFKQSDLAPLIRRLPAPFRYEVAGQSIEGRDIFRVEIGRGPVSVLSWSQMHGDESTATMALLDIFNFFQASGDGFDELRRRLQEELTLIFIPMLNPDGAERFQRRNALDVDLNRDAMRLQCPESQLLKRLRDELDADWGFNLHDQSRYYSAGRNPHTATLSFLAPAFNYEKQVNQKRADAMRVIGMLSEVLAQYIPGKIAKYNDDFEPRAFGDNMQLWGTRTILIESGGLQDDPEKQHIRKLNFLALMTAFDAIANGSYRGYDLEPYNNIPFNQRDGFHDLILREVKVERSGHWYTLDLGFRRDETPYNNHSDHYPRAGLDDIGDLSVFYAYHDLDGLGFRAVPGKRFPRVIGRAADLRELDPVQLLRQGYTDVSLGEQLPPERTADLPLRLLAPDRKADNSIRLGANPSLLLQKDGKTYYAIVNGRLYDLIKDGDAVRRAWRGI